jgi:hypothetical protein
MDTEIPLSQMHAAGFGTMPANPGHHAGLIAELKS